MSNNNKSKYYKLTYYTSGGYKTTATIETTYSIGRDADKKLCVIENGVVIGDCELIEKLLNDHQGWIEENTVIDAEEVSRC